MSAINNLVETFVDSLLKEEIMVVVIPNYSFLEVAEQQGIISGAKSIRKINHVETSRKYSQLFAVASVVAELYASQTTISQRGVYYSLKRIFRNQTECNSIVLELGLFWGLKRHEMNICPASRGFVAGMLSFRHKESEIDSQWIDCAHHTQEGGVAIGSIWTRSAGGLTGPPPASPPMVGRGKVEVRLTGCAKYLLLIEKEGVFRNLCVNEFHKQLPCIMVTGCGYPDIATRSLAFVLSKTIPDLVVIGLCDYNPCGLELLLTFKFGSVNMAFEGHGIQLKDMKWLGMRCVHVEQLLMAGGASECAQSLTVRDRQKIHKILNSSQMTVCS